MTAIESGEKVKTNSKTDANAHSKEKNTSYRNRALEFTQNAMEVSEDKGHSQAIVPIEKTEPDVHQDDTDDFDESDPVIMIPTIHLDETSLPPPPPRSSGEKEIHKHRQELRRQSIRNQRRERSMSRNKLNADVVKQQAEEKKSRSPRRTTSALKKMGNEDAIIAPPTTELKKSRRGGNKQSASKPRKRHDSPTPVSTAPVHPSLAVLTAFENHRQKIEVGEPEITPVAAVGKPRRRQSRRSSHDQKEKMVKISAVKGPGENVDEDVQSETSSISTASAKHYQMQPEPTNELRSRHPELKGVVSDPHKFPPVNVTVDRSISRSKSRPRLKVGVDPVDAPEEKEMQLAGYDKTSSRRLSSARGNELGVRKRSSKVEKKSSREQDVSTTDNKRVTKHSSGRQLSKTTSSRSHHRENFKVHPEESSPAQKTLTTSSARVSKRASRSLSGYVRDAEGKDVSEKRISKSAERSSSHANSSPALMSGKQRRCKSSGTSGTSRGGRSPLTSTTQPESLSSGELLRKSSTKERPVIIHKKRATRRSRKEERRETVDSFDDDVKPVTAISYSEDERSHASSISAGSTSTVEESFGSDCEDEKGTDEEKIPADVREKAISVLKDVKGGAKNIAEKGKSALGGLKGTSKKWQSAMFM